MCAEAFNPDDEEEEKEPRVNSLMLHWSCVHVGCSNGVSWKKGKTLGILFIHCGANSRVVLNMFGLFCRSPIQKQTNRDGDYRRRVGTFFCSRT